MMRFIYSGGDFIEAHNSIHYIRSRLLRLNRSRLFICSLVRLVSVKLGDNMVPIPRVLKNKSTESRGLIVS